MSKIAEQKSLEAYPNALIGNLDNLKKDGFIKGYDQALCDIKQRVKEIIEHQEKEYGKPNVDIGLYTVLGHIVEIEEES